MSAHNRERREIRQRVKAGKAITMVESVKSRRHSERKLRSSVPSFLNAYANGYRQRAWAAWQIQALLDAGVSM